MVSAAKALKEVLTIPVMEVGNLTPENAEAVLVAGLHGRVDDLTHARGRVVGGCARRTDRVLCGDGSRRDRFTPV